MADAPKKILLLLVEDEAMIREMYEMILTKKGFDVDYAEDGETALNKISENPSAYGLVLLDIMLPKVDGITVLKKLKQNDSTKNIPVFLLTNLGQESLIKEAMNLGAAQYWIKSNIFPMDLVKEIEAFLNKIEEQITGGQSVPASTNNNQAQPSTAPPPEPQKSS